ncbi:unnamed protein product [Rangifer tarandus platyrhynchus]|uniref:Uncharacterized protein n=2 Tax=Rangifer tarandus platyrhynchus TaxID=3082113 RepID=A0ABN8Y7P6_RANTA|nr:unnamed protein product [Rangifer tarandus platyrhynchus]CAI9695313.1 unnamed protein product [Rangifer tarandus platyrhynchus]
MFAFAWTACHLWVQQCRVQCGRPACEQVDDSSVWGPSQATFPETAPPRRSAHRSSAPFGALTTTCTMPVLAAEDTGDTVSAFLEAEGKETERPLHSPEELSPSLIKDTRVAVVWNRWSYLRGGLQERFEEGAPIGELEPDQPDNNCLLIEATYFTVLFMPSVAPQPAYAPLTGSEGDLRSTSARRQGTLALDRPNFSSAARPRLERGLEIPANSETEQQRTEAASSGRGREAARRGAAHPPRNRGAAPSTNPRFQPRAPAGPPQPRSAPGSGAGTSDAERSFQSSDPLKKQDPLAGADGD